MMPLTLASCLLPLASVGPAFQPVMAASPCLGVSWSPGLLLGAAILIAVFIVFAAGATAQIVAVDCQDGSSPPVLLSFPPLPGDVIPDATCPSCRTAIPETLRRYKHLPDTGRVMLIMEICPCCGLAMDQIPGYPRRLDGAGFSTYDRSPYRRRGYLEFMRSWKILGTQQHSERACLSKAGGMSDSVLHRELRRIAGDAGLHPGDLIPSAALPPILRRPMGKQKSTEPGRAGPGTPEAAA
jgi:hypothetical protein